ncbi:MAG: lytic transglycosylase domain-containing protein [Sphingomonas sp.]
MDWGSLSDVSALRACHSQIVEGRAKIVTAAPPPVRIEAPAPDTRSFSIAKRRPGDDAMGTKAGTKPIAFSAPASGRTAAISDIIEDVASRHRVDPRLLHAVIAVESGYRSGSISPVGARGLMQVMPATARALGVAPAALFDPATNIEAGARLLRRLGGRYAGDLSLILAAYNAGEGAVDRYAGTIPPYRETQNYVDKVMKQYQYLISSEN